MDKYIGFGLAYNKTVACVVQRKGKPDTYAALPTDVDIMRQRLDKQRKSGDRLHLTTKQPPANGHDALGHAVCPAAQSVLSVEPGEGPKEKNC